MQKFNEWADKRIKLSFQEKYNMLISRLSNLNSMKMSADAALKNNKSCGYGCGCIAYVGSVDANKSVDELVQEVDSMWNELKKEVTASVKAHDKAKKG